MSSFIPSNPAAPADAPVPNDGWFPDLSVVELRDWTRLGSVLGDASLKATLQAAMIEVNHGLKSWRATLTQPALADVPAPVYDGVSEKINLYKMGVYCRARANLIETARDYDSTKSGHDRADALEDTADTWFRLSSESLSRLTERPRTIVDLI